MASAKKYFSLPSQFSETASTGVEFQESDIWSSGDGRVRLISQSSLESHMKSQTPTPRSWKRSSGRKIPSVFCRSGHSPALVSSSLPVNIPDWSKILGADGEKWRREGGEDPEADLHGSDDEDEEWIPPHEYAARKAIKRNEKMVAFSVQEGVGRPLKGRDLWRVRNAIWKHTGFED